MIAALLILMTLTGVTPLTPEQRAELALDDPAEQLEGPGLGALLGNILTWQDQPTDETGVVAPDYDALLADPLAHRGKLCLVQGRFAGRARRYRLSGGIHPWFGDALTEWVLLVKDDPEEVAVVYFLDPNGSMKAPPVGTEVQAVARFYKVWADLDQEGNPTRYLTFVAREANVAGQRVLSTPITMTNMLILLVVMGLIYFNIRMVIRSKRRSDQDSTTNPAYAMLSDPTQEDPAKALERLADRRHDS